MEGKGREVWEVFATLHCVDGLHADCVLSLRFTVQLTVLLLLLLSNYHKERMRGFLITTQSFPIDWILGGRTMTIGCLN